MKFIFLTILLITLPTLSLSDEVNVEAIKKKYWTKGEKTKLGVVQNRKYSKTGKWQLGVLGGLVSSDPFLDTQSLGVSAGYHFNEYFSLSVMAWKFMVSDSAAHQKFREFQGAEASTNKPNYYVGAEGSASLIYGKLSLLGESIIYYDLYFTLGSGVTATETGKYFTPSVGIGQRFFLSNSFSLRIDFRQMVYRETLIEKTIPTKIGEPIGERTNWSSAIFIGVDFLTDF